ncbi:MAG TPA: aldolase/citrate lyase family protein [Alphaproteobacteria bacterium]|nr:aldolase/citrate lyase family protein [Alphaproteobacteria bacterium]
MRPNNLRTIWNKGGAVVNGWLGIPNSFSAEVMATLGWDSLVIDLQHGLVDYQTSVLMMQAISTTSVTPLVRVPWNDPAIIMKCLDAGAYGVICPMINDREEAERFVGACRYPPRGYRSAGPIRGLIYGGSDYQSKSDETIVALAMIETADGVKHLDEICSTPGLDALYIGPNDLSLSHGGKGGLDQTDAKIVALIDRILATSKRHKIKAGIHTGSVAYAKAMIAKGFDLVTVLSDNRILAQFGKEVVAQMRGEGGKAGPGGVY